MHCADIVISKFFHLLLSFSKERYAIVNFIYIGPKSYIMNFKKKKLIAIFSRVCSKRDRGVYIL